MFISLFLSLFATRIILAELGEQDYGIYVVVGGVVAMLSFLNISMSSSTQRYLSFSMGKNDIVEVRKVFSNSILLHIILGIFLVIFFEVFGRTLILNHLKIPVDRIQTAEVLFHFVVASTFISIISVPYDGLINAKENMLFLSFTSILESVLKVLIALSLLSPFADKLFVFGLLTMVNTFLIRLIKQIYCFRVYKNECKISIFGGYNKSVFKELYSFAGWNLIGVMGFVFKTQGITVILNVFFGTVINAAYGIANQVNSQLIMFTGSMVQSIQPQIVKSESAGDRSRMLRLAIISSKFSFYLFTLFALPLFLSLKYILNLWLVDVPEGTIIFCQLIIVLTLLQQFRTGILISTHAIGKIKEYQFFNAPVQLLSLPLGYVFLKIGYPPYSIIIASLIIEVIIVFLNILFFKKLTNYLPIDYLKKVVLTCSLSLIITYLSLYLINTYILMYLDPFLRLITLTIVSSLLFGLVVFTIGLNDFEKKKVYELIKSFKNKFFSKI